MKMEMWFEENVAENGDIKNDIGIVVANVNVNPFLSLHIKAQKSRENSDCESQDNWICISFGRDEETSTISGIAICFENQQEMYNVLAAPFFGGLSSN